MQFITQVILRISASIRECCLCRIAKPYRRLEAWSSRYVPSLSRLPRFLVLAAQPSDVLAALTMVKWMELRKEVQCSCFSSGRIICNPYVWLHGASWFKLYSWLWRDLVCTSCVCWLPCPFFFQTGEKGFDLSDLWRSRTSPSTDKKRDAALSSFKRWRRGGGRSGTGHAQPSAEENGSLLKFLALVSSSGGYTYGCGVCSIGCLEDLRKLTRPP
jgi:hypothetical protein